ncbi:hypothetical protein BDK51DRAFT_33514 [Blyttiomyces helicus]|uniref:Pericentriolar material 1 protein C-terminal domain-containing protein n=1 Tax=Blyttiomyces helicus TaxID=388810 RepID=A0A4P9WN60_9FUNG|nr:hypothetical protein BDK51DRAFT_33514 [Blyttiomyces helicus]|eukprot:RKO92196.1 hypothetical protein BDK51DRAFT_33514 [Blyttiomyces helicus]
MLRDSPSPQGVADTSDAALFSDTTAVATNIVPPKLASSISIVESGRQSASSPAPPLAISEITQAQNAHVVSDVSAKHLPAPDDATCIAKAAEIDEVAVTRVSAAVLVEGEADRAAQTPSSLEQYEEIQSAGVALAERRRRREEIATLLRTSIMPTIKSGDSSVAGSREEDDDARSGTPSDPESGNIDGEESEYDSEGFIDPHEHERAMEQLAILKELQETRKHNLAEIDMLHEINRREHNQQQTQLRILNEKQAELEALRQKVAALQSYTGMGSSEDEDEIEDNHESSHSQVALTSEKTLSGSEALDAIEASLRLIKSKASDSSEDDSDPSRQQRTDSQRAAILELQKRLQTIQTLQAQVDEQSRAHEALVSGHRSLSGPSTDPAAALASLARMEKELDLLERKQDALKVHRDASSHAATASGAPVRSAVDDLMARLSASSVEDRVATRCAGERAERIEDVGAVEPRDSDRSTAAGLRPAEVGQIEADVEDGIEKILGHMMSLQKVRGAFGSEGKEHFDSLFSGLQSQLEDLKKVQNEVLFYRGILKNTNMAGKKNSVSTLLTDSQKQMFSPIRRRNRVGDSEVLNEPSQASTGKGTQTDGIGAATTSRTSSSTPFDLINESAKGPPRRRYLSHSSQASSRQAAKEDDADDVTGFAEMGSGRRGSWIETAKVNEYRIDETGEEDQPLRPTSLMRKTMPKIESAVCSVISRHSQEPYFLLQALRGIFQLDSVYLRQKFLLMLDDLLDEKDVMDVDTDNESKQDKKKTAPPDRQRGLWANPREPLAPLYESFQSSKEDQTQEADAEEECFEDAFQSTDPTIVQYHSRQFAFVNHLKSLTSNPDIKKFTVDHISDVKTYVFNILSHRSIPSTLRFPLTSKTSIFTPDPDPSASSIPPEITSWLVGRVRPELDNLLNPFVGAIISRARSTMCEAVFVTVAGVVRVLVRSVAEEGEVEEGETVRDRRDAESDAQGDVSSVLEGLVGLVERFEKNSVPANSGCSTAATAVDRGEL